MSFFDLIRFTTATIGTGPITVGAAVAGYRTPAVASVPDGTVTSYSILDGSNYETGQGVTGSSGAVLARTTIYASSDDGRAISLSGTAQVMFCDLSEDFIPLISVKSFGAKGDGITDDTSALQAAIDYALAVRGKLCGVSGVFITSAALTIGTGSVNRYSGFDFGGTGRTDWRNWQGATKVQGTEIRYTGDAAIEAVIVINRDAWRFTYIHDMTLSCGDSNKAKAKYGISSHSSETSKFTYERLLFVYVGTCFGCLIGTGVNGEFFSHCDIEAVYVDGFWYCSSGQSYIHSFEHCYCLLNDGGSYFEWDFSNAGGGINILDFNGTSDHESFDPDAGTTNTTFLLDNTGNQGSSVSVVGGRLEWITRLYKSVGTNPGHMSAIDIAALEVVVDNDLADGGNAIRQFITLGGKAELIKIRSCKFYGIHAGIGLYGQGSVNCNVSFGATPRAYVEWDNCIFWGMREPPIVDLAYVRASTTGYKGISAGHRFYNCRYVEPTTLQTFPLDGTEMGFANATQKTRGWSENALAHSGTSDNLLVRPQFVLTRGTYSAGPDAPWVATSADGTPCTSIGFLDYQNAYGVGTISNSPYAKLLRIPAGTEIHQDIAAADLTADPGYAIAGNSYWFITWKLVYNSLAGTVSGALRFAVEDSAGNVWAERKFTNSVGQSGPGVLTLTATIPRQNSPAAWVAGHSYRIGAFATNDSPPKVYQVVAVPDHALSGTSAESGGPSGTGSSIADDRLTWRYVGPAAGFAQHPRIKIDNSGNSNQFSIDIEYQQVTSGFHSSFADSTIAAYASNEMWGTAGTTGRFWSRFALPHKDDYYGQAGSHPILDLESDIYLSSTDERLKYYANSGWYSFERSTVGSAVPTSGSYAYRDVVVNAAVTWGNSPLGWIQLTAGNVCCSENWQPATAYDSGALRYSGVNVYQSITSGTSASSGGPAGTGSSIADGTVAWRFVGTLAPIACATAWVGSHDYSVAGTTAANGSNVYQVVTPGTSASTGGPTGTGFSITDNDVVWKYIGPLAMFDTTGFSGVNIYPVGSGPSDTARALVYESLGTGGHHFHTPGGCQFAVADVPGAVNHLAAFGNSTTNAPVLAPIGADTDISLSLRGKGTGLVLLGTTATATAAAGAATCNAQSGIITTEAGTNTPAGVCYTLTLHNSFIGGTASIVFASVDFGTNSIDAMAVERVTPSAGKAIINVRNTHASLAWNGSIQIRFYVNG